MNPPAGEKTLAPPTPRAAAAAGVLFAMLYGAAVVLVRLAWPRGVSEGADLRADPVAMVSLALHLVAFGGIAFLWFMGVVRTRIGRHEDRFLSTVLAAACCFWR